jgi:hypothetical protein
MEEIKIDGQASCFSTELTVFKVLFFDRDTVHVMSKQYGS